MTSRSNRIRAASGALPSSRSRPRRRDLFSFNIASEWFGQTRQRVPLIRRPSAVERADSGELLIPLTYQEQTLSAVSASTVRTWRAQ